MVVQTELVGQEAQRPAHAEAAAETFLAAFVGGTAAAVAKAVAAALPGAVTAALGERPARGAKIRWLDAWNCSFSRGWSRPRGIGAWAKCLTLFSW